MKRYFPKNLLLYCSLSAGLLTSVTALHAGERTDRPVSGKAAPFFQDSTDTYTGVVLNESGFPVVGAQVSVGAGPAVTTDDKGVFSLKGGKGDPLLVRYHNILVSRLQLTDDKAPQIRLRNTNLAWKASQEVQLLHNLQAQPALTAASTQAVYNTDIQKMPVTSVRATLPGRLAGLYTNQVSGRPGSDDVNLTLRGAGSPLVLVDGIPRDITIFDLAEIESVTLLKDALATAMLGVRGSNGALAITTKKGIKAKQQISFTAQSALQQPMKAPKALNAYDYARLYNEAAQNDGLAAPYSPSDLDLYQNGSDPYGHPDVDWRKQVLRNSSRFDRYTLDARGGNNTARYYVALEHFNQTGIFKTVDTNTYNTNNNFKSYVIRSNVDININSKLSSGIYLLGRILHGDGPGNFATNTILNSLLQTPNNAYPVFNPDGSYGGTDIYTNNIWATATGMGYTQNYKRDMLTDVYLKRTLDELTKGLWVKATASYFSNISENIVRNKTVAVFQRVVDPSTGAVSYKQFGTNGTQSNTNYVEFQGRSNYLELALGYNRTFGHHGVDAIVLGNRDNYVTGSDLPLTYTGTSGRVAYNYKGKYVAEASWGLNGTNRYPEKAATRLGFFPAVGLAWNLHQEAFLQDQQWIDNLKLFGSFGKTGSGAPWDYDYIQRYPDAVSPRFGTGSGSTQTAIMQGDLVNPNRTFEQAQKLNLGVTGSLFASKLFFTAEYYRNKFYDLLMQRGRSNAMLGANYPLENLGSSRFQGMDLQLGYNNKLGGFEYFISGNAGIVNSELLFADEVFRQYDWMKRTGKRVGQDFGYVAQGLFQTDAEATSSPTIEGYTPQAGDIKYQDLNKDGVINQFDQAPIGNQKPVITYGVDLGFNFKGFDFSALLHGVQNRQIYLTGIGYLPFQQFGNGFGQAYAHNLNRWTPATAATADYPRLNLGYNANNHANSSYWYRSGNFLRLKNVVLGYTLPSRITSLVKLKGARVFVTGTNLLTFNSLKDIDPEVYNGAYPIQRLTNIGLNIKL
ncbi:SusC/RagA family TonB-linked outer membrane protein [Paraflavisolibacter sp. H34]|uniref:SusC/RagA family TonB-linked outer membrane protein n=1 Tax=Huijunlia imazamoxiresistens TaxID=3127457 RepID=UPI0030191BC8